MPSRPITLPTSSPAAGTPGTPPAVLRWPAFDATGVVDAVVTTRQGGVSLEPHASLNLGLHVGDDPAAVVENRRRAASAIDCTIDDLVVAHQVHGCHVTVVDATHAGRGTRSANDAIPDTDALVTTTPGVALMILVADCVPVVLLDPVAGVLGCVHAGWRGTAAGVTPAAVDAMIERGAEPARIVAGIGPAVDPDRYEVGDEVAEALADRLGDDSNAGLTGHTGHAGKVLRPTAPGRWRCDLVAANRLALVGAGVPTDAIHHLPLTTADPKLFSHRGGSQGRFAALARLTAFDHPSPGIAS